MRKYNDHRMNKGFPVRWSSNNSDMSQQDLFIAATYHLSELVNYVRIRMFAENDKGEFSVKLNLSDTSSITEQRHRGFGRCWTIYPEENIRKYGVYYMKIEL